MSYKGIPYSGLSETQQQIVLGGPSGASSAPAPVLTALPTQQFSWIYSGPSPSFWGLYESFAVVPGQEISVVPGSRTGTLIDDGRPDVGDNVVLVGLSEDQSEFVTSPSNIAITID